MTIMCNNNFLFLEMWKKLYRVWQSPNMLLTIVVTLTLTLTLTITITNFTDIDIYASPISRGELKQPGTTKLMQSGSPLD